MRRIKAAAIQCGSDPRWTPSEWANHLRWQIASCREAGADLAVFPAWTGAYRETYPRGFPAEALGTMTHLLGGMAREADLHLVAGSVPVRCAGAVRLRSFFLSPAGELLGAQDQLCPPPGYAPGDELAVFSSAIGRIGIIIGADAFVPEIPRILALQGADLFCVPQAIPAPYNPWRQVAGIWQAVQANQVPAVEACLIGEFNGEKYAGRSCVVGTVEMTPDGRGVVSEAASTDQTEIVAGEIDFEAVERARSSFPIFAGFNIPLYRRMLPEFYRRGTV